MNEVMMMLGPFQFSLETAVYQEFSRTTAWTWAAQARFGQDDALQFTGNGQDTITLPGVVYPLFKGGTIQLDELRALGDARMPHAMIDGRGNMLGDWVVEGVDERGAVFGPAGVALRQEFAVKLRRAPSEDGGGLIAAAAGIVSSGFPITSNLAISAKTLASTAANASGGILASLNSSLANVTGYAAQLGAQASTVNAAIRGGINAAKTLQNAGSDVGSLLSGVKSLSGIPSAMNGLVNVGGSVSRAAGVASSTLNAARVLVADPAASAAVRDGMVGINQLNVLAVSVRATAQSIIGKIL